MAIDNPATSFWVPHMIFQGFGPLLWAGTVETVKLAVLSLAASLILGLAGAAKAIPSASFFMAFLSEANRGGFRSGYPPFQPWNRLLRRRPSCTYNFAFSGMGSAIRVYL